MPAVPAFLCATTTTARSTTLADLDCRLFGPVGVRGQILIVDVERIFCAGEGSGPDVDYRFSEPSGVRGRILIVDFPSRRGPGGPRIPVVHHKLKEVFLEVFLEVCLEVFLAILHHQCWCNTASTHVRAPRVSVATPPVLGKHHQHKCSSSSRFGGNNARSFRSASSTACAQKERRC